MAYSGKAATESRQDWDGALKNLGEDSLRGTAEMSSRALSQLLSIASVHFEWFVWPPGD